MHMDDVAGETHPSRRTSSQSTCRCTARRQWSTSTPAAARSPATRARRRRRNAHRRRRPASCGCRWTAANLCRPRHWAAGWACPRGWRRRLSRSWTWRMVVRGEREEEGVTGVGRCLFGHLYVPLLLPLEVQAQVQVQVQLPGAGCGCGLSLWRNVCPPCTPHPTLESYPKPNINKLPLLVSALFLLLTTTPHNSCSHQFLPNTTAHSTPTTSRFHAPTPNQNRNHGGHPREAQAQVCGFQRGHQSRR
jgi:hypothetical protein